MGWLADRLGAREVFAVLLVVQGMAAVAYLAVDAFAAFVAVVVTIVLMIFDPHLTYRGSADAFFGMFALVGLQHRRNNENIGGAGCDTY